MTRRTLKILAYSPFASVASSALAIIAVACAVPFAIAFAAHLAVSSLVGAAVVYFIQHALRRGPGTLGRRLGWVGFMLLLPIIALPSYYNDVVSRISDNQPIEVVVATHTADRDSGSIPL